MDYNGKLSTTSGRSWKLKLHFITRECTSSAHTSNDVDNRSAKLVVTTPSRILARTPRSDLFSAHSQLLNNHRWFHPLVDQLPLMSTLFCPHRRLPILMFLLQRRSDALHLTHPETLRLFQPSSHLTCAHYLPWILIRPGNSYVIMD
jgi:hypothetical protein